jgi:hypothetical protein
MKTNKALPFSVLLARRNDTSARIFATRLRSYGRHNDPLQDSEHFRTQLINDDAVLISAESKLSGECLGSIRIETNYSKQFYFEQEITTPELTVRNPSICASRLNVTNGRAGSLVRSALCKALYLYAHAVQAEHIYAFVDRPRARLYSRLGFVPAVAGNPELALECHNGLAFQLYKSDVTAFQSYLPSVDAEMFDFVFKTHHPDIKIFSSVGSRSQISRKYDDDKGDKPLNTTLMPSPTV